MKKKFKLITLLALGFSISISSCEEDVVEEKTPGLETVLLECNSFQDNNPDKILVLEDRNNSVDYIIDCMASVEVDLVIEPGVTIEFSDNAGLRVRENGSLEAVGSQSKPILFTGELKTKGAWKGVFSASEKVKNRLEYVTIAYAGGGGIGAGPEGALVLYSDIYYRLNNVTIENSSSTGIDATFINYDIEINNCTITNCNLPMNIDATIVNFISGGDFTGNTIDVLRLEGDNVLRGVTHTWRNLGVPYRMADNLVINDGTSLTLNPGVVVEFEDTKGVTIDNQFDDGSFIIAEGTSTNPITFTGVNKSPGAWSSIYYRYSTSTQNSLSNVILEYAGGSGAGGAIQMYADPVVNVSNSTFKDIDGCGIYDYDDTLNPNLSESNNTTEGTTGAMICYEP